MKEMLHHIVCAQMWCGKCQTILATASAGMINVYWPGEDAPRIQKVYCDGCCYDVWRGCLLKCPPWTKVARITLYTVAGGER
jgi:hypothetical protein